MKIINLLMQELQFLIANKTNQIFFLFKSECIFYKNQIIIIINNLP